MPMLRVGMPFWTLCVRSLVCPAQGSLASLIALVLRNFYLKALPVMAL
ncbi:Unknown protein sequence [Pseudomonas syringae pv. maculicola]|nr:Unknown protein sequence [Pseudomonas syringae pv. maculicola]